MGNGEDKNNTTLILESINDAFFSLNHDWEFVYVNCNAEKLLKKTKDELIGKNIWKIFPEAIGSAFQKNYLDVISSGKSVHFEEFYEPLDTWFEVHAYPFEDGISVYFNNISKRKLIEEKIHDSEEKYRTLFDTMAQGVVYQDKDGHIISANPAAERILGIPLEEMIGRVSTDKRWKALNEDGSEFPGEQHPAIVALKTGKKVNDVVMGIFNSEEDQYKWIKISAVPLFQDGETIPYQVYTSFEDITDRKRIMEELEIQKKEFETVAENLPDTIVRVDRSMGIVYINKAIEKLLKLPEKTSDNNDSDNIVIPEQIIEKSEEAFTRVFNTGKPEIIELSYQLNGRILYYYARLVPEFDKKGKVTSALGIIQDITHQKETEKRKDEFISMASHELKTPITSVKAYTQILKKLLSSLSSKNAQLYIEKMEIQVNKLTDLISDLLNVSKINQGKLDYQLEEFDFDIFLHDVIENVQNTTISHKIILNGETHRIIKADKDRLSQVIINLLTNAIKYSPNAEEVIVNSFSYNNHINVKITDQGIGISQSHQGHIFERFYRVSNTESKLFPGLGIGLYISHEIVKKHGGDILVESEEGKGSTFTVILPVI